MENFFSNHFLHCNIFSGYPQKSFSGTYFKTQMELKHSHLKYFSLRHSRFISRYLFNIKNFYTLVSIYYNEEWIVLQIYPKKWFEVQDLFVYTFIGIEAMNIALFFFFFLFFLIDKNSFFT